MLRMTVLVEIHKFISKLMVTCIQQKKKWRNGILKQKLT